MKFKVGEIVLLHTVRKWVTWPEILPIEVEVVEVGPFQAGHIYANKGMAAVEADYRVVTAAGAFFSVKEWQLRKRPERGIPKEVREIFEIQVNA